jgi:Xaa-Pro dipeptidase
MLADRHARLYQAIQGQGLHALALNAGPSLTYLTGLNFHLSERPAVALFAPGRPVGLIIPELEAGKAQALDFDAQVFAYGEDPIGWGAVFRRGLDAALGFANPRSWQIGVEPRRMRVLELRLLEEAAPWVSFVGADESLGALRRSKDAAEVALMRKAVDIAQRALLATLPQVKTGATEREIAAELTLQLLRHGSDSELPFAPIVSGGPNAANPHAVPSNRPLTNGDLLVIDWGASWQGYISDITRTFAIGEPESEIRSIYQAVMEANSAGRAAARPGAPASALDRAARAVIEAAGYGPAFIHRTGHGIGLESHEEPYIRADNAMVLEPGMAFTIEPGIYLAGRNGVRIEDNLVITDSGAECLTTLPRELQIIG